MASLRVPAPTPVPTSTLAKRRSFHMPLSSHGMPKAPRALSPERPHRFSAFGSPNSPSGSSPMTPLSPGPMSPPMSAKSFGTFIDSAPSTPAYSPRDLGGEWCSSQITILRPMSSSSLPSSPTEPSWDMMAPAKQPMTVRASEGRAIVRPELSTASSTPLALSKPVKRTKPALPVRATTTEIPKIAQVSSGEEALRRQAEAQARMLVEAEEAASASTTTVIAASPSVPKPRESGDNLQPEPSPKADTAPLGKLATRMKSLLRRNTSEKKKEKKPKSQQEFISLDDAHWTEM
jgi:pyruvate dehydrogenase phosphatase